MKQVPPRVLPLPTHVSEAARRFLEFCPESSPANPPLEDHEAWRDYITAYDRRLIDHYSGVANPVTLRRVRTEIIGAVTVFSVSPPNWDPSDKRVVLDVHGGGFILMGGDGARLLTAMLTDRLALPVISVDYRMPPDHPFPAGLDDCLTVYRHLLESRSSDRIILEGSSAGGNLAAATILKARDFGLSLPAGAVLLTPEIDLTEHGDSFATLAGIDPVLQSLLPVNMLYAGGTPLEHSYLSPLYADLSKGFPKTFIQSGTRDLFLSNAVNFHRALRRVDIEAHLHVWEAMPHAGFGGAPEDAEMDGEIKKFIEQCWG